MVEKSSPWANSGIGDDQVYTDDDWSDLWRKMFTLDRASQGVLLGFLNELNATAAGGVASPVTVESGAAIVDGKFYESTASEDIVIPNPAAATRIDRIVLRKDWAAHTVRLYRIAGVEGAGVPAITQIDGNTWDLPLWRIQIIVGGVINDVVDERYWAQTPMHVIPNINEGRLTPNSGGTSPSDYTGVSTLYLTAYTGNKISLWDGTRWIITEFGTPSVSVPATTNTPFDVFAEIASDGEREVTLSTTDWTNDTTRAIALTTQDSVWVKTGDIAKKYIGTARTTGVSGETEDSVERRLVWNFYNRFPRLLKAYVTSAHSYATGSWRAWDNDTTIGDTRVDFIVGLADQIIDVFVGDARWFVLNALTNVNFGHNSTTTPEADINIQGHNIEEVAGNTSTLYGLTTFSPVTPSLGYNYLQAIEYGAASGVTLIAVQLMSKLFG